ncbi:MAG: NAD(P)-dependent alcohol dehydrogenase [Pseudomonadota bacterium]
MKAVLHRRYGGPEVLQLGELPRPEPGDDDVLIRVRAAEVTKGDCEMRSFRFAVKWFWLPLRLALGVFRPRRPVLGGYFAGTVEATGANVTRYSVGDNVFGSSKLLLGAYAQYLRVPSSYTIARMPANLSHEQAAAVPLGGLNALHFMRRARVAPGETVLVNGAGGSIGSFAVQIARNQGARVVAVDGAHKAAMLRDLGVERVIDYAVEDFLDSGETYDVIFDMVAGSNYRGCVRALKPAGRYLKGNPRFLDLLRSGFTSAVSGKTVTVAFARESQEELETLAQMLEAGDIAPVIDRVYAMDNAAEAHRRVESEQRLGIVVLRID